VSQRPNIILIVADDMGYGDFGVFNNLVRTPSLDQLVSEGICLTQHYAGSPVCSPSRAALLTGRYPHRTGAFTPQEVLGLDRISLQETTLGNAFQQAGYRTGLIGKWHNGALDKRYHPNARGFDEFVGFSGGWADYYRWILDYNGQPRPSDGTYLTDVLTDEAIQFVQRHRQNPFFLCLMYNAPHSPLQAPQNLVQPYYDLGLRPAVATTYAMIEAMDRGVGRLMTELEQQHLAENTIVLFTSDNGPAFMLRPDQLPADMDRNTTRFNCGFAGAKGSVYEGGIRVPMVVRWPAALRAGVTVDAFTHFTDWFPTLLNLAGGPLPSGPLPSGPLPSGPLPDGLPLDGHDIGPALRGEPLQEEPRRFWQFNNYFPVAGVNAAMRDGDWKLVFPSIHIPFASAIDQAMADTYVNLDIEYKYNPESIPEIRTDLFPERILPAPPRPELYNIREDPLELNNLSEQEPSRLGLMVSAVETWFEEVAAEGMRSRM
jgi:arylsulfatase A-like enzyme